MSWLRFFSRLFSTWGYHATPPDKITVGRTPARITVLSGGRARSRRDRRRRTVA